MIPLPTFSEGTQDVFSYIFVSRIHQLDMQRGSTVFAEQAKITRLQGNIHRFIEGKPYSIFQIVIPTNNMDKIEDCDYRVEIKNFQYYLESLDPTRYVVVINNSWNSFDVYQETVDKNLIPMQL